jgi:hypothetical protein
VVMCVVAALAITGVYTANYFVYRSHRLAVNPAHRFVATLVAA